MTAHAKPLIIVEYLHHADGWEWIISQNGICRHHSEGYPTRSLAKRAANDILKHLRATATIIKLTPGVTRIEPPPCRGCWE